MALTVALTVALMVALSLPTSRMAKRNVIVRKLPAVESPGSCTCIASDKTGTLTVNQQTVKRIELPTAENLRVTGEGYNDNGKVETVDGKPHSESTLAILEEIARAGVLSNEASLNRVDGKWEHNGDAVDVALLAFGHKMGLKPEEVQEKHPTLREIPFESEKRYAGKIYKNNSKAEIAIKGATESILPFCKHMRSRGDVELDAKAVDGRALKMAEEGYRVLAIAVGEVSDDTDFEKFSADDIPPLILLGLVGFIDPLRPKVKEAVHTARNAGVQVVMITGDHPATALAIARELDIAETKKDVITGQELAEIGSYEVPKFIEKIKRARLFARVTPMQKLHIVEAVIKDLTAPSLVPFYSFLGAHQQAVNCHAAGFAPTGGALALDLHEAGCRDQIEVFAFRMRTVQAALPALWIETGFKWGGMLQEYGGSHSLCAAIISSTSASICSKSNSAAVCGSSKAA